MRPITQVYSEALKVDRRLRQLGLTSEILRSAIAAGELERVSCTELDPKSFPGISAWGFTVRHLRQRLLPRGWRKEDTSNLPLVIEPRLGIALAIAAGSPATGLAELTPTTKHPKGPMTWNQVTVNRLQQVLFPDQSDLIPTPAEEERITWFLLIRTEYRPGIDDSGEHIARCELSLPAELDEHGFVSLWFERIILDPVTLDSVSLPSDNDDEDQDEAEFDVPVTRRN